MKWISVKERLPESFSLDNMSKILVLWRGLITEATYHKDGIAGQWCHHGCCAQDENGECQFETHDTPTHWMPLPDLPEEK